MMANYTVLIACAGGCSSSLLESKAKQAAAAQGHILQIHALSVEAIQFIDLAAHPIDVILIAPQVRFKLKSITEIAAPHGIVVQVVDSTVYGMVDGEKLFEQILAARQAIR